MADAEENQEAATADESVEETVATTNETTSPLPSMSEDKGADDATTITATTTPAPVSGSVAEVEESKEDHSVQTPTTTTTETQQEEQDDSASTTSTATATSTSAALPTINTADANEEDKELQQSAQQPPQPAPSKPTPTPASAPVAAASPITEEHTQPTTTTTTTTQQAKQVSVAASQPSPPQQQQQHQQQPKEEQQKQPSTGEEEEEERGGGGAVNLSRAGELHPKNHVFLGFQYPACRSGSKVEGVAVLVLAEEARVKTIQLQWTGQERVQWCAGLSPEPVTETRRILNETTTIFSSENEEGQLLSPGTHTYKFEWTLPARLPRSRDTNSSRSTTTSSTGNTAAASAWSLAGELLGSSTSASSIHYIAVPKVDTAAGSPPVTFAASGLRRLHVMEGIEPHEYDKPTAVESTTRPVLLGGRDVIEAKLHLFRKTFFVGEEMHMGLQVHNRSKKRVERITIALWEHRILQADERTQTSQNVVASSLVPESHVTPRTSIFMDLPFLLPSHDVGSVTQGHLVRVTYSIEVKLVMGMASSLSVKVPIRIVDHDGESQRMLAQYMPKQMRFAPEAAETPASGADMTEPAVLVSADGEQVEESAE